MGRRKKDAGKYISIYLDADQLRVVGDQPAKKVKALVVQAISNDLLGHLGAPLADHLASQGATASIEGNTVVITRPGTPVNKYVQISPQDDRHGAGDAMPVLPTNIDDYKVNKLEGETVLLPKPPTAPQSYVSRWTCKCGQRNFSSGKCSRCGATV